jgi:mono/diheme cytochrome c family protein
MIMAFLRWLILPLVAPAMIVLLDPRPASAADPVADPSVGLGLSGPAQPPTPSSAPARIYRASCLKCHDSDGKGEIVRDVMPKVPDFTDAAWQSSRSDAELGHSILEGKGKSMPRMRDKIAPVDVGQMVAFVRAFRGGKQVVEDGEESPTAPEPSAAPLPATGPAPPASQPARPGPKELGLREGGRNFQRSCVACHGKDGRGDGVRDSLPSIPDFTSGAWQASRTDPQLLVSVLDGKGAEMPPFRDKVSREQARDLVAFIRSLDPSPRPAPPTTPDDFEARFRQLLAEFEDLRRRSRALSADAAPTPGVPPGPGPSTPSPVPRTGRDGPQSSGDGRAGSGG